LINETNTTKINPFDEIDLIDLEAETSLIPNPFDEIEIETEKH
jgi:hypothetical protein